MWSCACFQVSATAPDGRAPIITFLLIPTHLTHPLTRLDDRNIARRKVQCLQCKCLSCLCSPFHSPSNTFFRCSNTFFRCSLAPLAESSWCDCYRSVRTRVAGGCLRQRRSFAACRHPRLQRGSGPLLRRISVPIHTTWGRRRTVSKVLKETNWIAAFGPYLEGRSCVA